METKPWSMIWTSLDPGTKIMKTVMVVQSGRDARVKRSHANGREAIRRAVARTTGTPRRSWRSLFGK